MIIKDLTDTDLYKLTTMLAIQKKFPRAVVKYSFVNRGNTEFPDGFGSELASHIREFEGLTLSKDAEKFIREKCYYLDPVFVDLLKGYRYDPAEVEVTQKDGYLNIEITGLWYRAVLWEVPLLALISELFYETMKAVPASVKENAIMKARELKKLQAKYSDFGTRRRYSFDVHDQVIETLKKYSDGYFIGTSNVYLAMKHDLSPIGTHPHEWFMYHGAHYGYRQANTTALDNWVDVYKGELGIALTDTYTSDAFFREFSKLHAKLFDGIRWDSGDPEHFTEKAIQHYKSLGIDPKSKTIVYSDALNLEKIARIKQVINGRIQDAYGIGTYLTNDVGVDPLNIVIKMTGARTGHTSNFIPTVKLSDDKGKYTGDPREIELCSKMVLNG